MGLSVAEMNDHVEIIKKLKERCNAGRNRHVWRQIFAGKKQLEGQAADDWLCELRICINVYMYVCVYKGFSPFRVASWAWLEECSVEQKQRKYLDPKRRESMAWPSATTDNSRKKRKWPLCNHYHVGLFEREKKASRKSFFPQELNRAQQVIGSKTPDIAPKPPASCRTGVHSFFHNHVAAHISSYPIFLLLVAQ